MSITSHISASKAAISAVYFFAKIGAKSGLKFALQIIYTSLNPYTLQGTSRQKIRISLPLGNTSIKKSETLPTSATIKLTI